MRGSGEGVGAYTFTEGGKVKYITLTDLREWLGAYDRQEITMSRLQELINEKVEERLKEEECPK